jgi:hypothetical protein
MIENRWGEPHATSVVGIFLAFYSRKVIKISTLAFERKFDVMVELKNFIA